MKQEILRGEDNYSCTLSQEVQDIAKKELQVNIILLSNTQDGLKAWIRFGCRFRV